MQNDVSVLSRSRVNIFVGAYGSGKSEVAVNFAITISNTMRESADYVVLADLDVINPFYRSADARAVLLDNGIKLISSQFVNTNVEAPSVPPEVFSVFDKPGVKAVLDIGGEDMGARIVSSLKDRITAVDHELFMVININRPFTRNTDEIVKMIRELESACGISITGLVNNTNLLEMSSYRDIEDSDPIIRNVSRLTGIPYVFSAGMTEYHPDDMSLQLNGEVPFLKMIRTVLYNT